MGEHDAEIASLRRERDLYLRLLDLGRNTALDPFLREALALVVELVAARQGYLELHDDDNDPPRWWIAHGFSAPEIEDIRTAISRGIIAEAIASGRTVTTPSALADPRFKDRESVRRARIEGVLCAPIGEDPPRGVLYLQGRSTPGLFSEEDRARAELFARHLAPLVDRLLAERRREAAADPLQPFRAKLKLDGLVGRSAALRAVVEQLSFVAPLDVNVLLTGDSGTGKSLLAQVIHQSGARARGPFLEINCGALPETLVESELFGALPGAHSTATQRVEGKVAAAAGGTLFLDEIGVLPLSAQAKLLQLLQSKQFFPLGASKAVQADVRVIAATNLDLARAVAERQFREDLFYRLQVLPIRVPSLAERREDIPELARFFCAGACNRHGLPRLEPTRSALGALESAEWPGNIRQLAHAVEAAVIRAAGQGASQVEPRHLFPEAADGAAGRENPDGVEEPSDALSLQEATRRFQARLVRDTLERTGWNVVEAAKRLDVARSYLYKLIRAFGLERK
jgi:Nif-specific regulatory protein